jgi:small subunit ribosomal protein S5
MTTEKISHEMKDMVVDVRRVAKVVKGGRRFAFAVVVVVGDKNGCVGCGLGKAKEVAEAKIKAVKDARSKVVKIPLFHDRTISHDIEGRFSSGHVILRTAPPGTGIIAGGAMRSIFEMMGVSDIVAKSIGSNNTHNMIYATFDALAKLRTPEYVAAKRSKKVSEITDYAGL